MVIYANVLPAVILSDAGGKIAFSDLVEESLNVGQKRR